MSDFIAYQYDDQGFYVGEVECQRDPKRNKPLLPRNCTFIKPPADNGYMWFNGNWIEVKKEPISEPVEDWKQKVINRVIKKLSDSPNSTEIKEVIKDLMDIL